MLVRQTHKYVKDLSTIFYKYSNYDKTVFLKAPKSKIFLYPHHRLAWIVIVSSSNEARLQGI